MLIISSVQYGGQTAQTELIKNTEKYSEIKERWFYMKRPMQKLIAFSTAVLSMLSFNVTPTVSAEYKVEVLEKCEYDELIEMRNKGILIKNGNDYTVNDDTEIVVIDENGERKLISKDEGISGVYCYVSTTMGQYNFISVTCDPYSFDFHDMSYRISTEGKSMIVGVGDKFAIMNDDNKVVSDTYNNIYRINDNYFNVDNAEDTSYSWETGCYAENKTGLVNADGDVIVPVTDGIQGFFTCGEEFIVKSDDGFYLIDSTGKKTSAVYSDVCSLAGEDFAGIGNGRGKYAVDYNINSSIFRMAVDEDTYCLYNSNTKEYSAYYDNISILMVNEAKSSMFFLCQKGDTYTLYDTDLKPVVKDADGISTVYSGEDDTTTNPATAIYDICVDKDGITTTYDLELNVKSTVPTHEQSFNFGGGVLTIDGTDVNIWNYDYTESTHVDIPSTYNGYELNSISYETYTESGADVELDVEYSDEYSYTTSCLYKFVIDSSLASHDVSDYEKIEKIGTDTALLKKSYDSSFEYVDYINNTEKPFVEDYSSIRYIIADKEDWRDDDVIISYYLINDTSFIVCDTSLNPTTDVIEGKPETNCPNENVFSVADESGEEPTYKYGIFTLTEGITAPAEYDSLSKGYNGFLALKDGNTNIITKNGELIKSLDGAYNFLAATRAPYDVNWNLYKREGGVLSTVIYNIDDDVVRYEQTGKYDYVSYFENDYAVVAIGNNDNNDDYYWSKNDYADGLIYIDGKEKIKPDKSLNLSIIRDKTDNLCINIEVSLPYNDEGKTVTSYFSPALKELNFEFAEEHNMLFAFANDAGNYLVVKDGLWGMYSPDGNALIEPSFCFVDNSVDNLYVVNTPESYTCKTYSINNNGEKYDFTENTVIKTGVIDIDGRIVIKPFCNIPEDGMEIEEEAYKSYYIKTVVQDNYGTHICKTDVNGNPRYSTIRYSDVSNDFALKYGYDIARQDGNLYYVEKDGLAGVVSDANDVLVPIEYRDILSFNPSRSAISDARPSLSDELIKEEYSSKFNRCENGNIIVYVQNMDKKVGAYLITESSSVPYGDINSDNLIDASDASLVLSEYSSLSIGGESKFSDIQRKSADLNGNGIIDSVDASFILNYYSLVATGSKKTIFEYMAEIKQQ